MLNLRARDTLSPYWAPGKFPVKSPTLLIDELPLGGIIRLQGVAEDSKFRTAVQEAVGVQPPNVGRFIRTNQYEFVWTGPREWILFVPVHKEQEMCDALNRNFQGTFATAALMSDSRFAVEVKGSHAPDFLAKGTGLNTDVDVSPAGTATTTRFLGLPAMLIHEEPGTYRLYFDVSFAAFVMFWLLDAAEEFLTQIA